ncbi:hypothetical protein LLG34_06500, partial [bacterium]|nr:hypothetical protein [bacterium]
MKKINRYLLFLLILIFAHSSYSFSSAKEELNEQALRIQEHLKYLASDELEGRFPGTPGIEKAKDYILSYYKSLGLKPINGNYLQSFSMPLGCELGKSNNVYFNLIIP